MEKLKGGDYKLIDCKKVCKMQRRKMPPIALRCFTVSESNTSCTVFDTHPLALLSGFFGFMAGAAPSSDRHAGRSNLERDGRNRCLGVNHFQRTTTKYKI